MSTYNDWGNGPAAEHDEPAATASTGAEQPLRPRRARAGTIVWGLIVVALAAVMILAEVATISLDMGQVAIGLLIGAGLSLVVGGLISAKYREKDDKRS